MKGLVVLYFNKLNVTILNPTATNKTKATAGFQSSVKAKKSIIICLLTIPEITSPMAKITPTIKLTIVSLRFFMFKIVEAPTIIQLIASTMQVSIFIYFFFKFLF